MKNPCTSWDLLFSVSTCFGGLATGLESKVYEKKTAEIKDIPVKDTSQGVTAYAYICVEDKWYFYNAETTVNFKELYDANYLQAAYIYGW